MFNKPEYFYQSILLTITALVFLAVVSSIDVFESELKIKKFDEGMKMEKPPEDELSFKDLELSANHSGPIQNSIQNETDSRQSSFKDYSQDINAGDASEQSAQEFEKSLWEQAEGNKIREELEATKNENKEKVVSTQEKNNPLDSKSNKFAGRVMVHFKVGVNRTAFNNNNWYVRNPGYTCGQGSGRVVVDILVSSDGRVKKASLNKEQSINANQCMMDKAIEYAKKSKFSIMATSNQDETGYIVYEFVSQ